MSDNIPFELQGEIMKRLPVKSLLQFRTVSKSWKSLIDSTDFIKNYSSQQQHLLVRYEDITDYMDKYVLIADDHTFPHQKVSVTIPLLVKTLKSYSPICCSHGLLFLYGDYQKGSDGPVSGTGRAVIWNPFIRKALGVVVPNVADNRIYETVLGFGVCPKTTDPKIVKITHIEKWSKKASISCIPRQVEVFTLSTRAWRRPYTTNLPRKSIQFDCCRRGVALYGVFYWLVTDRITVDGEIRSRLNLIISFDMTNEEFREVNLPISLAHQPIDNLSISKLRESPVLLEYGAEIDDPVFHVWMMENSVSKSFTKLFTVNMPNASEVNVTGFRKTGELIINNAGEDYDSNGSLDVYEPHSKSISSLGINGRDFSYYMYPYIETLLLL